MAPARSRPTLWPWLLLLLSALAVSAGIVWDLGPLMVTASGLRPRAAATRAAPAEALGERRVRLLLRGAEGRLVEREERIPRRPLLADEVQAVLVAMYRDGTLPPAGAEVRHVFLDAFGILYLDLTRHFQEWLEASPAEAELSIRAAVASLAASFEPVERVQFLVEGQESGAAAGGVDLRRPVRPAGEEPGGPAEVQTGTSQGPSAEPPEAR